MKKPLEQQKGCFREFERHRQRRGGNSRRKGERIYEEMDVNDGKMLNILFA